MTLKPKRGEDITEITSREGECGGEAHVYEGSIEREWGAMVNWTLGWKPEVEKKEKKEVVGRSEREKMSE